MQNLLMLFKKKKKNSHKKKKQKETPKQIWERNLWASYEQLAQKVPWSEHRSRWESL